MEALAEQPRINFEQTHNHYQRHYRDTATWLAETLNGSMRTSFEFSFNGHELYAEDGGKIAQIFEDAISEATVLAEKQPNLLFELRRRLIEAGEYAAMLDMAAGNAPNTMIVISDFPGELMDASEDVGGYNTTRQQTMMRIITWQLNGTIRITTQSLDRSNRTGLEAIYESLGAEARPGELLEQRVQRQMTETQQAELTDYLTSVYDDSLSAQYTGSWHAGIRQPSENSTANTYNFVLEQHDILEHFARQKTLDSIAAERLRYDVAALVSERFEQRARANVVPISYAPSYQPASRMLYQELERAGTKAAEQGKTFSGCGATVRSELSDSENQLREAGFGNDTKEDTKYSFDKKMHCLVCQSPPKKGETKKQCGPCGICRGCDKKLGGKG